MREVIANSVLMLAFALLLAEGALAQSEPGLLGTWHLNVVGDGGLNARRPSFGEAQTLRIIEGQGGGLAIHNEASSGLIVPLVAQGNGTWVTTLGPHYTLTLKDNRLRILGNGRDYGFGRSEFETTPAVFGGHGEVIRFTADWAQRSLFTRLRSTFEAEQDRQFEACFSDRECLKLCEHAAGSCEDLTDVVARLLDRLKTGDPLFYHVVDGINIRIAAENRRTILRHEAELARSLSSTYFRIGSYFA